MKTQEIRIGNWVNQNRKKLIVDESYLIDILKNHNKGKVIGYNPIRLTDKWFDKFGFLYFSLNNGWHFHIKYDEKAFACGAFEVFRPHTSNTHNCRGPANTKIRYVHELQNIFFDLTKKELK